MKTFYGTFGSGHLGGVGIDRYVEIEAENVTDAYTIMAENFGKKWCTVYASAEEAGVERYGLIRLCPKIRASLMTFR